MATIDDFNDCVAACNDDNECIEECNKKFYTDDKMNGDILLIDCGDKNIGPCFEYKD